MLVNKRNVKFGITDVVVFVICAVFTVGIFTWFAPCAPMAEGMYMVCHWAGNAIASLAILLTVISAVHILLSDGKMKLGVDICILSIAITAAIIPGNVISLCAHSSAHCTELTKPFTIVFSVLTALAAAFDFCYYFMRERKK